MKEEKLYDIIAEHLRYLNKQLEQTNREIQSSLLRMDEMDNEQMRLKEPLWYRTMN